MKKLLTLINSKLTVLSWLTLAFISLFYTKAFDLGFVYLGLPREGEFLGLILRLADFTLISWLLYIFSTQILLWVKSKSWQNISKQTIQISVLFAALVAYWCISNFETWYSFKGGILAYGSLIFSLISFYRYRPSWLLILVPYFCFDHIILSSSLVSLMLVLLGYLARYSNVVTPSQSSQPPSLRLDPLKGVYSYSNQRQPGHDMCRPEQSEGSKLTDLKTTTTILLILTLTITTNLLLATYQVFWGQSFGLYFFGESKLELSGIIGIAKQVLPNSDQVLLRGYGLMPHPNILGFLGVFGVIVGLEFKRFFLELKENKQFQASITTNILIIFSFLLGLISMSRMAIISLSILSIIYFVPIKLITKIWHNTILSLVIFSSFVAILMFVSFDFKADSDNYRLEQYQTMAKLIKQEPQALFFGTGIGQYSQHLKKANITTESWENEAFYHPLGNVILEFGLVGVFLCMYFMTRFNSEK